MNNASTIFTYKNILRAYKQCIKRKKNTANALKFELNREKNLSKLLYELQSKNYKISRHICFIVTKPSPREIFAADFRDRIVHHLLYNEVRSIFEKDFIDTSYANRVGKGTHKAMKKLRWHISRGGVDGKRLYCLKLDVQNFFRSIDRQTLWDLVSSKIMSLNDKSDDWKDEILRVVNIIIFHDPVSNYIYKGHISLQQQIKKEKSLIYGDRNTGLPIGNLTSQFFANIYLNELDQFVTGKSGTGTFGIGCTKYVRYVDDFVIINEDIIKLRACTIRINHFLKDELKMRLHPNKIYLQPVCHGVDFLGYFIKHTHTLVRRSVVSRFRKKLGDCLDENGFVSIGDIPMIRSYVGHFGHVASYNLIRSL